MVRFGPVKAASEGSLTVLDDERVPRCRVDPRGDVSSPAEATLIASGIFECLLVPHKHAGVTMSVQGRPNSGADVRLA